VNLFADWLSKTSLSLAISTHEWVVPAVQSIHIIAIGGVLASVFMIDLRILGWAGRDQTLTQTATRFGPWLSWALCVLLLTGAAMVVGEPARELLALSFWLKMGLVVIGTAVAVLFQRSLRRYQVQWETTLVHRQSIKALAILTLLTWISVAILGRLIAYDYVWGSWSRPLKG
jgi:uncharacterized metal-binding protein